MKNRSLPSVMNHSFSQVPSVHLRRSQFDRSHGHKTTFDAGYLVPFYVDEALPGDTFSLNATIFARMATPLRPIMDNMFCDTFFFAVPYRLVMDHWERLQGEQPNPGDTTDFLTPITTSPVGGFLYGSLYDYFGVPTGVANLPVVNLHARAYNLIHREWFRDQNLQDSVVVDKDDGPDDPTDYVLLRRGKRHDYFTSALPWPQKGPAVTLPLGSSAPVLGIGPIDLTNSNAPQSFFETGSSTTVSHARGKVISGGTTQPYQLGVQLTSDGTQPLIYADLSDATAATINQLREALTIQHLYERDARGGTRYTEIIRAHFGVVSPDARLQRPEYLGGGSTPIVINPISQNTPTSGASTPLGTLAAVGTISASGHGFTKSFTEHCLILGLVNVRADLNYQQGLNRMWSRRTRFDFFLPDLANLGEQAILNKEIYAQGTSADDDVFGYQERWAEYRYKPSIITGKFRSTDAQSLDVWHLAQEFGALPVLNDEFIVDEPPVDRVIATPSEPHFLFDSYISLKCARPMPVYSVPGLNRF